jgi:intein/homing endonuclease
MPKTNDVYLGNPLLKRAHTESELTYEQIIELAKCEQDPLYFATNYIQIVTLDHGLQPFSLYSFQKKMLRTFHDNRFIICKLPRQPLALDTPVPTPRGWSTIGKLRVGDRVFSSAGQTTKIVAKSETYTDAQCYKITFDCDESIVAESDHLWEVFDNKVKKIFTTKQLFENNTNQFLLKRAPLKGSNKRLPSDWDKEIKITSVDLTDTVPVACIEVENNTHMFLCGKNFIPHKNCGKSTTVVSYLIHSLIFNEKFSIAILANKASTAKDLLARLAVSYENLPKWIQSGVKSWNKTSVELENGSKVMAASTSASAVRGGTYNIIFLDEFAFVPNQIAANFMNSVYPTITSGDNSKVIIVSCVTKDTYLLTPQGYRKMESIIDSSKTGAYYTNDYTVYGRDKFYQGNIVVNSGKVKTNNITTRLGSLECSEEHKLWAFKEGKYGYFKSSELSVGDYISLRYNQQIYGNQDHVGFQPTKDKNKNLFLCDTITHDIAYFVGLYIAEGYARKIFSENGNVKGGQIIISCGDDITEALDKIKIKYSKVDKFHYVINSLHLVKFLEFIGFDITKKAPTKIIPEKVLSWSKSNIIALLRGMFDGDGCATKTGKISYTSTSPELIRQVQLILSNMGILSSLYSNLVAPTERVKVFSRVYILEITGLFAKKFYEEVGFGFERKQIRFNNLKITQRKGNSLDIINDSIPILRENLNSKPNELKLLVNKSKKLKSLSRGIILSNKKLIYDNANEQLKGFLDDNVDKNLIWVKIKEITKSENEVFDVSLPDIDQDKWCHSVLYNNFLGHQTPNGRNLYYKMWDDAINKRNEYIPIEINWYDVPGRDEAWKQSVIANTSLRSWEQEFESFASDTLLTIEDCGIMRKITIGELYEVLANQ